MAGNRPVSFGRHGSTNGSALHVLHSLAQGVPEEEEDWDLKLSSPPSWCRSSSIEELRSDTRAKRDFIDGARDRIASSLGVDVSKVNVTAIESGSIHLKYTVSDLTLKEKERILQADVTGKLRNQFDTFVALKVSPAVLALHFNLDDMDEKGNKSSHEFSSTHQVGPPGKQRTYFQPCGWTRYGFKVLGKYTGDTWLHPFQDAGNWYRAFHSTGRSNDPSAPKKIVDGGFRASAGGKLGAGVYVTPKSQYSEAHYCAKIQLQTTSGPKAFSYMLQVAVRPGSIINEGYPDGSGINQEWTVDPKDVRPYGLLVKEV
ncbi:unnamed protein product [Prorocentrum cordatum]|uniref:PARP n=1 Tax=Prorocentrum cordatum TaxID=2364126 RepID=A0ABN9XST1_9DINO|nr:unnamed protein product [Polarella glacialis]CAK0903055.1 unnamed protein product [Polarella glacialis]